MTAREDIEGTTGTALTDAMHLVLGAVTYMLIFSALAFGAAAFGKRFRLYSILTAVTVLVFGALYIPGFARIAEGDPTPWLGVFERTSLGAWWLWIAVLAIILLRERRPVADTTPKPGRAMGRASQTRWAQRNTPSQPLASAPTARSTKAAASPDGSNDGR